MDSKKYILGLGNPIIDISAEANEETLKKYELVAGQTIFCNDTNMPFYDYLESKPEVTYIPGGSVTNSIRVSNVKKNKKKFFMNFPIKFSYFFNLFQFIFYLVASPKFRKIWLHAFGLHRKG